MKNYTLTKSAVLILLCSFLVAIEGSCQEKEKRENLNGDWKFAIGDNKKFARPEYNDSDWEKIYVPAMWQNEGFRNYHGYAWYRKTIEIDVENKDALYLELGRIDDVDEVYLNGHLIGRTGGFPPNYYTGFNYQRKYYMPTEHINKGGKNVIAVRVYDEGGEGGILGSSVGIYNYTNYSANSFHLFGNWKFHLFDDPQWSEESFDDKDWDDIIVPSTWEAQGFGQYDGFAWYRKTFKLPANFKTSDLMVVLGKIDDMDEVFVNGKRIGGTGRIDKKWASDEEHEKTRTYLIPEGLLKAGKDNVIAVRVYDQVGDGGIYQGPVTLLPRSEYKEFWKEYRNNNYFDWSHWWSYFD